MSRILIIEDEEAIAELEKDYLELSGFEVIICNRGDLGLNMALKEDFDLIILDLMLPEIDGFEICRQVREAKNTPIIMVSAKKDDIDKIRGLGLGADDYMTKPFSPSELVARVKAHMDRYNRLIGSTTQKNDIIEIRGIKIDKTARRVWVNGEEKTFTTKEFDLLTFLAQNPNRVFTKEELFRKIWDMESVGDIATVTVHIKKIREKIEYNNAKPQYIEAMLHELEQGSDIVIGSRFLTVKKPKTLRMLGSYIISWSIRLTTGRAICDPTSGMRMFNRAMVEEFAQNLNYGPEPDTISYLIKNGATVKEVQVEMGERMAGQSYLTFWRSVQYMVKMAISILLIQWFRKRDTETPYPERSL